MWIERNQSRQINPDFSTQNKSPVAQLVEQRTDRGCYATITHRLTSVCNNGLMPNFNPRVDCSNQSW
jgi:hypothetical protein